MPARAGRCTHEQTDLALRLGAALWQFWLLRGHTHEGRGWLTQVLQLATVETTQPGLNEARGEALAGAGFLAMRQGDFAAARTLFGHSLLIRRDLGDAAGVAMCLNDLGVLADDEGEYAAALELHEQSLAI